MTSNFIKKTFIIELNKYIALYGAISYFVKKEEKSVNIVNPRNKLSFLIDQKGNKEGIQLQLSKLYGRLAELNENKIENFAILSSMKNKYIGQKKMRNKEIVDTIFITGL